jgi:hypothetical protein
MSKFTSMLKDAGIPDSRTFSLENGIETLHRAICKLDLANLRIWNSQSIAEWMRDFTTAEHMRAIDIIDSEDAERRISGEQERTADALAECEEMQRRNLTLHDLNIEQQKEIHRLKDIIRDKEQNIRDV